MKSIKFLFMVMIASLSIGFSACSDDKDEPTPTVSGELVSQNVPTKQGWSGDLVNGVAKFIDSSDSYEDEGIAYMAFSFKDGVCKDGVINVVMPNESYAKSLESMLKSGEWGDVDDDDDDYYRGAPTLKVTRAMMCSDSNSRAGSETMPINVSRSGKVIYMQIPNIKGLTSDEVMHAVELWNGGYYIPTEVVFGKYENGVYTCNNMLGIGLDYRIDTSFTNGYCTKFLSTLSFTSNGWARMMYYDLLETIQDNSDEYNSLFGATPKLSIDGNKVTLEAVIAGNVDKDTVDNFIAAIDWYNNRPILWDLFN